MLNKIVIFDFDDTLFPTTHVITTKSFTEEEIKKINESIKQLFENLWERNYKIIVITNAELEWIKTWKEYIPILNEVDIYSARDKYEKKNIPQNNWKKLLYLNLFTKKLLNYNYVVCVGDSENDKEAADTLSMYLNHFSNINVKFIKIPISPTINKLIIIHELLQQHEYLN